MRGGGGGGGGGSGYDNDDHEMNAAAISNPLRSSSHTSHPAALTNLHEPPSFKTKNTKQNKASRHALRHPLPAMIRVRPYNDEHRVTRQRWQRRPSRRVHDRLLRNLHAHHREAGNHGVAWVQRVTTIGTTRESMTACLMKRAALRQYRDFRGCRSRHRRHLRGGGDCKHVFLNKR
jgi:hypothetical protein